MPPETLHGCGRCKHLLPLSAFFYRRDGRIQSWCKSCRNEDRRIKRARRLEGRCCVCCEKPLSRTMHWQAKFCSPNCRSLFWNYRLTIRRRDEILASQGGGCGICGTRRPAENGWHIDHDRSCCPGHRSCGHCVRGVLCPRCNRAIGQFEDNPTLLRAAIEYLEAIRV